MEKLKCKDHLVSGETFELVPHDSYEVLFTHPSPKTQKPYYNHPNYISHQQTGSGLLYFIYDMLRRLNNEYKLKLINDVCPEKQNLLDFGAGAASFVKAAQKNGWNAKGFDPIITQATQNPELYIGRWVREKHYHCITAWHVLEHLKTPQEFLFQAHGCLVDNGILALALPNWASWDAAYYQADWAAYDVPRHLWHFTPNGIKAMAKDCGFELIKQRPLRLDAYYVSLLSEKIKKNSFSWIRAAIKGTQSNCKANRTGMYSSLIYLFQKAK